MGSHGGATVEGQRHVLAEYGITEDTVGAPIRATMDTVELGTVPSGAVVHFDANAARAQTPPSSSIASRPTPRFGARSKAACAR